MGESEQAVTSYGELSELIALARKLGVVKLELREPEWGVPEVSVSLRSEAWGGELEHRETQHPTMSRQAFERSATRSERPIAEQQKAKDPETPADVRLRRQREELGEI